ncbi:MAG: BtpA/SgcQ family protein [bacterium]|nr:BtpA/SgcQ family protein [bacterium]
MTDYRSVFPRRNTFLAVVHVENVIQALRNVRVALGEGADGVFLINHRIPAEHLHLCYGAVRAVFPTQWIGLNWLDLSPTNGLAMMRPSMGGMWIDNVGIREDGHGNSQAVYFSEKRYEWMKKWNGSFLLFGGVAFKYQQPVKNLEQVTLLAKPYVDVITTSGDGTGIAPDVGKIRTMKQAIGNHPLAIASGITPENAVEYMEYADCFLVATGISDSHTELNPKRVAKLVKIVS